MTQTPTFSGKLALQQRVLPSYRAPFVERLGRACEGGLTVFAGEPAPIEAIESAGDIPGVIRFPAHNREWFHPRHPLFYAQQPNITEWLDATQPNALIVEANPRYGSTPAAIRWMHKHGKPVLGWGLGAPPLGRHPLNWLRAKQRARLLHSLDGVIAYSRRGAEQYRAVGIPHVFTAFNAAAPPPAAPPPKRPLQLDAPPHVLFVGRMQARKRLEILFEACAELPSSLQPQITLVGNGPAREGFESLAQTVYPQAKFVGAKHGPELDAFFAAADLFVLPGTGGLAVQQAMSHGLPVIVAQGDGTQDDLVRPENGWQVSPGDVDALRNTLETALTDIPALRRMGNASYRIVAEEINLDAMVGQFIRAVMFFTSST